MIIHLSDVAKKRILAIGQYLEENAPEYRDHVMSAIRQRIMGLSSFPLRNKIVEKLHRQDVRETYVMSYRISYLVEPDAIIVLTVEHMRQRRGRLIYPQHNKD